MMDTKAQPRALKSFSGMHPITDAVNQTWSICSFHLVILCKIMTSVNLNDQSSSMLLVAMFGLLGFVLLLILFWMQNNQFALSEQCDCIHSLMQWMHGYLSCISNCTNKPYLRPFDNVSRSSEIHCHAPSANPAQVCVVAWRSPPHLPFCTCSDRHSPRQIRDGLYSEPLSDHRRGTVDACSTRRPRQEYQRQSCFGRGNNEHCLMLAEVTLAAMWKGAAGGLGVLVLRKNHVLLNACCLLCWSVVS